MVREEDQLGGIQKRDEGVYVLIQKCLFITGVHYMQGDIFSLGKELTVF